MRAIGKALGILGGVALSLSAGCLVEPDDLVGQTCTEDGQCPEGYACRALPTGTRGCVLAYPPQRDGGARADAGPPGPVRYYCNDIKPLLDYYCVSCHGAEVREGGQFRLDYYELDGGPPGARAMSSQIKFRVALARTMPPPDAGAFPSDAERARFTQWVDAGSPFCAPPTGGGTDGGRDGGRAEGGG